MILEFAAPGPRRAAVFTRQAHRPHIVFGITSAQTCLTLKGRLRALRGAGFQVTLISSPGQWLADLVQEEGVDAIPVPMQRGIAPFADLVSFIRIWAILRQLRPDMTEFSTPKAGLLGNVASMLVGVPARVYMLRGLKLEGAVGFKRLLLLAAERISAGCAQVVLCNSPSVQGKARKLGLAPRSKIRMLGKGSSNGVDEGRFSPGSSDVRAQLQIQTDAPVIGFVGRLTRDKGVPELIEAFDEILHVVPDAYLLLVGWFDAAEDALDSAWRHRIKSHTRIVWVGFVVDTAPYYRAMDVMVLPTWREGFPNVVLEAAATGIPVITTIATGSRDSVVPGLTGVLIPPGDPHAIAEACIDLLQDPERRSCMGRAARGWVCKHFSRQVVLNLAVGFYQSLLKPRQPGLRIVPRKIAAVGKFQVQPEVAAPCALIGAKIAIKVDVG